MSKPFRTTPWAIASAFLRSLSGRLALIPLVGFGVAWTTHSGLAGLGAGVAMLVSVLVALKLEDDRRRRRSDREHIAGLQRW
jgi:hypothetical protein